MLERRLKSKIAKAVFYDDYNDIDIFIEDTAKGYKKLFSKLLSRVLGSNYKINNVFPLGGRLEVVGACTRDQKTRDRARLYIVDGDLFLLTGEDISLNGLYVLPRYCIENHLICFNSLVKFMEEEDIEREYSHLSALFNIDSWIDSVKTDLLTLFIEYGVAKSIAPHLQTVAFGYSGLVSGNSGEVDHLKVTERINNLKHDVISHAGEEKYNQERKKISSKVSYDMDSLLKYVSGKDILMPLLMMRVKSIVKTTAANISIKHRLSNSCNIDSLNDIHNFVAIN
ncbi:TPA: DUF4435 domain-containing protein [Aeromonas salmonicida subsp. pectinolytica]